MLSTIWNALLFHPFLNILTLLYKVLGNNLGWAVIVIAALTRLILIPAMKSQMDMSKKLAGLKPELAKLQKKYANNQKKLSEEQVKLYKESGYNPLGCFGSFLPQILILYAIIQVINVLTVNNFDGLYPFVKDWVFGTAIPTMSTNFYFINLTQTYTALAKEVGYMSWQTAPYLIIAVLVGIVQFFSTRFMQIMQGQMPTKSKKKDLTPEESQMQMMNSMNFMFPFLTVFISVSAPAVLGLYWLIQSLMLIVQYIFIEKEKFVDTLKQTFYIKK